LTIGLLALRTGRVKTFNLWSYLRNRDSTVNASDVRQFYDEHVVQINEPRRPDAATILHWLLGRGTGTSILERLKARGTVLVEQWRAGELVEVRVGDNLVVTTGLNAVIDRLQGTSVGVHDFQAIGTGTTAAVVGNTALETEIGTRVQGTLSQPAATTDRLVSTFAAGNGTGAITETGRLTAASGGNLFARQVFSVINKAAGDSLQVTHDITVS
jgi:hypothetical protein